MAGWFAKDPISRHRLFFLEELRGLRDYVQAAEQALAGQAADLDQRFDALAAQYEDPDEADLAMEPLRDEHWRISSIFPQIQRKALTASILGFVEHNLNVLCGALADREKIELKVTDLSGSGLKRANIYLTKVVGLDLSSISAAWEELARIQDVRNVIVHREGSISGKGAALRNYILKSPHLDLGALDVLEIKASFLPHVLQICEEFAGGVFDRSRAA